MYSQVRVYSVALSALKLSKQFVSINDDIHEVQVLNQFYDMAFQETLSELNLQGTRFKLKLELLDFKDELFKYVYKYPSTCMFFVRIFNGSKIDHKENQIRYEVEMKPPYKVILTDKQEAVGEWVDNRIQIEQLSSPAALAVAYKLAFLSSNLIVGTGDRTLADEVLESYKMQAGVAKAHDAQENMFFPTQEEQSEYVRSMTYGPE